MKKPTKLYECVEAVQTQERPSAPPVVVGTGTKAEMKRLVSLGASVPVGQPGSRWVREVPAATTATVTEQDMRRQQAETGHPARSIRQADADEVQPPEN